MKKRSGKNPLAQFDREQYADWLWRGLLAFYERPPERAEAFDSLGLVIMEQESVCEGLAHVYEEFVPESRKLQFRRAIGDVLREQTNSHDTPVDAFRDLIYLLARIRANESLDALLPAVGNGLVGKRHPEILYETVAVLRLLAPSDHAYETARGLADSANFDEGYLFDVIKVLVECKPSDVSAIVFKYEPRLSKLRQTCERLGGEEWTAFCEAATDWAQHVLTLGPKSWLNALSEKANQLTDPGWLFEVLARNQPSMSEEDYRTLRATLWRSYSEETVRWAADPNDKLNAWRPDQAYLYNHFDSSGGLQATLRRMLDLVLEGRPVGRNSVN